MTQQLTEIFNLEFNAFRLREQQEAKHTYTPLATSYETCQPFFTQRFKGSTKPAVVIDNGSYECRAGWSNMELPSLRFNNCSSKPRHFSGTGSLGKEVGDMTMVGNELEDFDMTKEGVRKPMFDRNVIFQRQVAEGTFDYIFLNMGLQKDSSIDYPVMVTEPLCNPYYSRDMVNQVMFECYRVPALSFGVDSVLGLYGSTAPHKKNALVISAGHTSTHIIPVLHNKISLPHSRRINLGGYHATEQLQRVLSMRFPQHKHHFTYDSVQEMHWKYTEVAQNYGDQLKFMEKFYREERKEEIIEDLRRIGDDDKIEREYTEKPLPPNTPKICYRNRYQKEAEEDLSLVNKTMTIIELPWQTQDSKDEVTLEASKVEEKRREQGRKLRDYMETRREVEKQQKENELVNLKSLLSLIQENGDISAKERLFKGGYKSIQECEERIEELEYKLNIRQKSKKTDAEKYDLLDIDDKDLDEEQIKRKRIQKMQKSQAIQREERKKKQQEEQKRIECLKDEDRDRYIKGLYDQRQEIVRRMTKRKRIQQEMSKRGSNLNKRRMRVMAGMMHAQDNDQPVYGVNQSENDNFGYDDEDWDVYRQLQCKENQLDEDDEDQEEINKLEKMIADVDPSFTLKMLQSTSLMPTEDDFRMKLWTDQYRPNEIHFNPSIISVDQGGIPEVLDHLFRTIKPEEKRKLLEYVFVTGGHSKIKGFCPRLSHELRMLSDPRQKINIVHKYEDTRKWIVEEDKNLNLRTSRWEAPEPVNDPSLDAWRGAAKFCQDKVVPYSSKYCITKKDYEECGTGYLKEHICSNINY